jgi:hypothetical protein
MDNCINQIHEYYRSLEKPFDTSKKEVWILFIEDYSKEETEYQAELNQQFFRICKALGVCGDNFGFIESSQFEDSWYGFRNLVVLGEDTLERLKLNNKFSKLLTTRPESIICIPSSKEMFLDLVKKKDGWDKLKRLILR